MKNINKIIISMIAIITIIIIIISIIIISSNKNEISKEEKTAIQEEQEQYLNAIKNPASVVNGKKPELVKIENIYYCAKNSIDKYFSYLKEKNVEAILGVLDSEYINANNLNTNTILSAKFLPKSVGEFNIEDMYSLDGTKYTTFYIKIIMDKKELYLILNIDFENKTFSIIPTNQEEYENTINTVVEGRTGQEKNIEINEYNELEVSNLTEEEIANKYFIDLKEKMISNLDTAYHVLDEEYKDKRFPKLSDFQEYIEENIQYIQNMILTKYSIESKDGYTQYLCVDNYQNNYIFKVTSVMKYTVLLDNYTVESEEFKTKYNGLKESEKISTNIDKFIKCINNKDYNQAYSFLDDGFKNNYFKDVQSFKRYIKDNFYDYNVVGKLDIKNEGDIFICTVSIKSGVGAGANTTTKTIIMQLKEGTDFVMSFSLEE